MKNIMYVFAVLLVATAALNAQSGATLRGTVTEAESSAPVPGASVKLTPDGSDRVVGTYTDVRGRYSIKNLPEGTYTIVVSSVGYQVLEAGTVKIGSQDVTQNFQLAPQILQTDVTVVTASRIEQKALDAPAAITVVEQRALLERPAQTPVEYLEGTAGVDQAPTGISQRNVNVRGFNNVFTGTLLTLTDYRMSGVPSLRANIPYFIPATNEDIQRIELVRGPGSALYGPNAAQGVMNVITHTPFSSRGTSMFMTGGFRSGTDVPGDDGNYYSHVGVRHAGVVDERFGYKISGQYVNAWDWVYQDPDEIAPRDNVHRHFNVDARLDYILSDDATVTLSGGWNRAVSSVEMTDIGTQMGRNWDYYNVNASLTWSDLFAQVFYNKSDAGETFNLRTGLPLVDRSSLLGSRLQHASYVGDNLRLTYGGDFFMTSPDTDGTINGANENDDSYNEIGAYLQADYKLIKDRLNVLVAGRMDKHSVLDEAVFSPRAALVWTPTTTQSIRATYNRAFTTPTSVDMFLDIQSRADLFGFSQLNPGQWGAVGIWASGTGRNGYSFARDANGLPLFYSQFNNFAAQSTLSNASGNGVWQSATAVILGRLAADTSLPAQTKALLQAFLQGIPAPENIAGIMATLNPSTGRFDPVSDVIDAPKLKPTITNTYEIGYQGNIADNFSLSVDAYYSVVENFISGQAIITPNVFLRSDQTYQYLQPLMKGALMQQGIPEAQAEQLSVAYAQQLAASYAQIPVGTVSPSETPHKGAILLTPRNFGEISYFGTDVAFQWVATDWLELGGAFTYMTKVGGSDTSDTKGLYWTAEEIGGVQDFAFNAPQYKASMYANWREPSSGLTVGARWRWTDGFQMISGVFVGDINAINIVDLNVQYLIPGVDGLRGTLQVMNLLDNRAQYFIGAPQIGRLTTFRIDYTF